MPKSGHGLACPTPSKLVARVFRRVDPLTTREGKLAAHQDRLFPSLSKIHEQDCASTAPPPTRYDRCRIECRGFGGTHETFIKVVCLCCPLPPGGPDGVRG